MKGASSDFTKSVFRLQRAMRRDITLTVSARLVGLELLDLVDWELGYAYPGQDFLAQQLDIDVRTIRTGLARVVVDQPPSIGQLVGTRYFRRVRHGKGFRYFPLMTPRRGIGTPERNDSRREQQHTKSSGVTPEENDARRYRTPENFAPNTGKNLQETPEKNVPESTLRNPLEEPLSAAATQTSAHVATPQGGLSEEVIERGQCTFAEFFEATGGRGEWGPAWAEWSKLNAADLQAISRIVIEEGAIDTGGAWATTWLRARGWEGATPKSRSLLRAADDLVAEFDSVSTRSNVLLVILKPYSAEWHAEHERRVAAGESVALMDSWASEGIGWQIRATEARRAS